MTDATGGRVSMTRYSNILQQTLRQPQKKKKEKVRRRHRTGSGTVGASDGMAALDRMGRSNGGRRGGGRDGRDGNDRTGAGEIGKRWRMVVR